MGRFFRLLLLCLLACQSGAFAGLSKTYSRNIWYPSYLGERLAYCLLDGKSCGMDVATPYCKALGYQKAGKVIKAHNVGLTNYYQSRARCKGWRCDGFKLIRCDGNILHKPPANYYYRSRKFMFPRFDHYRVDWCYENKSKCGERAAYSFCRRMGYLKAQRYLKQGGVPATKQIGDQALCFGQSCQGFRYIECFR